MKRCPEADDHAEDETTVSNGNDNAITYDEALDMLPWLNGPVIPDIRLVLLTPEQEAAVLAIAENLPRMLDNTARTIQAVVAGVKAFRENAAVVAQQITDGIERARPLILALDAWIAGGKDKKAA